MYYAVSDIHGCYSKFERLLAEINYSNEQDVLFVLGDVVDRGEDSIKVLELMMENDHIIPIMGNHDKMAYEILVQLEKKVVGESEKVRRKHIRTIRQITEYWFLQGGFPTLMEYRRLKKQRRLELLDYLGDFLPCFEISVNGRNFVLVYAGISDFDVEKSIQDYPRSAFLYERADYERIYYPDKFLITGHTTTDVIDPGCAGKIYKKNHHIAIDCGAVYGKTLGCICLDNMEEYYI